MEERSEEERCVREGVWLRDWWDMGKRGEGRGLAVMIGVVMDESEGDVESC